MQDYKFQIIIFLQEMDMKKIGIKFLLKNTCHSFNNIKDYSTDAKKLYCGKKKKKKHIRKYRFVQFLKDNANKAQQQLLNFVSTILIINL